MSTAKLSGPETYKVVNEYIGVTDGYLDGFSYSKHQEFYPHYCGLDIDVAKHRQEHGGGTTREVFLRILKDASPTDQAKILRGVLAKFPPETEQRRRLGPELLALIKRLEAAPGVSSPQPKITTDTVERAIRDAETLIKESGATSGVDRVHTALHGHLLAACDATGVTYGKDPTLAQLLKLLRQHHPKLQSTGPRAQDITQVLRAMGAILDALNPVRNHASVAHPNASLLEQHEAMLVINAAKTILHYLDAKLSS